MRNYGRKELRNQELARYYALRPNRRLKYAALGAISVTIILFVVMIVGYDSLSFKAMMLMRGFAGTFACIFVIITAVLLYRVNNAYQKDKDRRIRKNSH